MIGKMIDDVIELVGVGFELVTNLGKHLGEGLQRIGNGTFSGHAMTTPRGLKRIAANRFGDGTCRVVHSSQIFKNSRHPVSK